MDLSACVGRESGRQRESMQLHLQSQNCQHHSRQLGVGEFGAVAVFRGFGGTWQLGGGMGLGFGVGLVYLRGRLGAMWLGFGAIPFLFLWSAAVGRCGLCWGFFAALGLDGSFIRRIFSADVVELWFIGGLCFLGFEACGAVCWKKRRGWESTCGSGLVTSLLAFGGQRRDGDRENDVTSACSRGWGVFNLGGGGVICALG